jgi:hypothetical protein
MYWSSQPASFRFESMPFLLVFSRLSRFRAIWPSADEPVRGSYQHNGAVHRWEPALLDIFTGVVRCQATAAQPNTVPGKMYTDVMVADFRNWPHGLYADPRGVPGRAAWYSFAFLLRTAAAALLDGAW